MSAIPDEKLYQHATRAKGKVVLVTGAAKGIGKEVALRFASYGAKIVIGDLDSETGEHTTNEIKRAGGEAIFKKCNVTVWDDQVALFDFAISTYGAVDIVVANAGVAEMGTFGALLFDKDGKPAAPNMTTIQVNLVGLLYTVNLASHYLVQNYTPTADSFKSLVLLGSMASWAGIPGGPLYTATKHAVLGIMRSLWKDYEQRGIRMAVIHPWFADTAIVPVVVKVILSGLPLAPVPRIAGAIFYAATDPDPDTNGSAWLLPDGGNVFLLPREELKTGVYGVLDKRAITVIKFGSNVKHYINVTSDVFRYLGVPLLKTGVCVYAANLVWERRDAILASLQSVTQS